MKNFKKTLIALAVLALLVTSMAVMVVMAEEEPIYTGNIEDAQALLDKADPSMVIPDQTDALKTFYAYITANPINPTTEGYEAFVASYNNKSLVLFNKYYEIVDKQTDMAKKLEYVNTTYAFITACPIAAETPDPDADGPYLSYAELVSRLDAADLGLLVYYCNLAAASAQTDYAAARTNLNKVYTQLTKYPLNPETEGYAEFELNYNTVSVQISETLVAAVKAARDAWVVDKENAELITAYRSALEKTELPTLLTHMAACPVDTAKYEALAARLASLNVTVDLFEVDRFAFLLVDAQNLDVTGLSNPETAKQAFLGKIEVLLKDAVIDENTEGYADFIANYTVAKKAADDAMEARRVALDKQNSFFNYDLTDRLTRYDFDTSGWNVTHGNGEGEGHTYGKVVKNPDDPLHPSYMSVIYGSPKIYGPGNGPPYTYQKYQETSRGIVVQYDCMLEGTHGEHFESTTFGFRNGSGTPATFYQLVKFDYNTKTGTITATCNADAGTISDAKKSIDNVAAEGQWFNVILTMDPETRKGALYINYEYMFELYYGPVYGEYAEIRFNGHFTNQNINYDNYITYLGTQYRDVDKMNINDEEKFLLYSDYYLDETVIPQVRNEAYVNAKGLAKTIKALYEGKPESELTETELKYKELIAILEGYNYEENIVIPAKAANIQQIKNYVASLNAIEMISTNTSIISDNIAIVESFISKNSDFIDKSDSEYVAAIRAINTLKENVIKCENVVVFADALTQFTRATAYASMQKRATTAAEIYALSKYTYQENRDFVANDPVIVTFEKLINGTLTADDPAYVTAFEYYDSLPATMAEQLKRENSKRVIDCMGFVDDIVNGEYNEEVYVENSEEISFYMDVVRSIISAGNYNPEVEGVADAIEQFELVDEYFYKVLQDAHKEIISEQLAKFPVSDTYIEKVGICTYLDKYFADNDINMNDPDFAEYKYYLEIYKAELDAQAEIYKDKLEENTAYFIAAVKKMDSVLTYAELKPLYDEALTYYYGMNVDSEEAQNAIEKFAEYEDKIALIAESSRLFSDKAFFISIVQSSKDQDAIYNAIMDAMLYYQYADETYSASMKDSINTYLAALEAYNANANKINSEIDVVSGVVCSVRTNKIAAVILAVINHFVNN